MGTTQAAVAWTSRTADSWKAAAPNEAAADVRAHRRELAQSCGVLIHPEPAPDHIVESWHAAVGDAGMDIGRVALIWRLGRSRPTGQEAASWCPDSDIDPEFDDDHDFVRMLEWANREPARALPRVMVWAERTPEGLAGLLRHELEHTIQVATHRELENLHGRALEELSKRGGTGKSYNAIPMEVDANRAAARFLRRRYDGDRLRQLVSGGDRDAVCFRSTEDPDPLDKLLDRMRAFILEVMRDVDFVHQLESVSPAN